jgi:hypothetical protein
LRDCTGMIGAIVIIKCAAIAMWRLMVYAIIKFCLEALMRYWIVVSIIAAAGYYLYSNSETPPESLEGQYAAIAKFFRSQRIGIGSSYMLYKSGFVSSSEPIAVVFGFIDNEDACRKFADNLNAEEFKNSISPFYCKPTN